MGVSQHSGRIGRLLAIAILLACFLGTGQWQTPRALATVTPAFPGAMGYGANAQGGRGGRVIEVTNLNDSGAGSLRDALLQTGARTIIFRVGGTIDLQTPITLDGPSYSYLTIAGQSAPGGGIQLKSAPIVLTGGIHNVIIRHLRVRPGFTTGSNAERNGLVIYSADNTNKNHDIIVDHSSFYWQQDDNLAWGPNYNITLQWNIFAEGVGTRAPGYRTEGKKCLLVGQDQGQDQAINISLHHNYMANCDQRPPRLSSDGPIEVVNNVAYNWGSLGMSLNNRGSGIKLNLIGNYYKAGPNTSTNKYDVAFSHEPYTIAQPDNLVYVSDNIMPHRTNSSCSEWSMMGTEEYNYFAWKKAAPTSLQRATAWAAAPVPIVVQPSLTAAATVLDYVGATLPARDSADARVISDFKNGTGQIGSPDSSAINGPNAAGGPWPTLAAGTPPTDTDHDGMSDSWETSAGLNVNSASDGPLDADSDGYTNLEEFLNSTNPNVAQGTYAYPTPTSTVSANTTTTCGLAAPASPTGRGISPTASNLVQNPGFEAGTGSWPDYGVGSGVSLSSSAHSGTQAIRLGYDSALGQTFVGSELKSNTYYTLRAWGKVTGGGEEGYIWAIPYDSDGKALGSNVLTFKEQSYEEKYLSFVTPSNTAWIQVGVYNAGNMAYDFIVDDVSLAIGYVAPQPQNLLSDAGFEDGIGPWYNGGNAAVVASNAHSGTNAMQAGTGEAYSDQKVIVPAGKSYTLSGWGKLSATGATGAIGVRARDINGVSLQLWTLTYTTTTYLQQSLTFTTPVNTSRLDVYIYKAAGSAYFYADDLYLVDATPPPTELVQNPGFESGATIWNVYPSGTVVTSNSNSGTKAMQVGTGTGGGDQTINVSANTAYRLRIWGKVTAPGDYSKVDVFVRDAAGTTLTTYTFTFNETSYTPKGVEFTTPANAAKVAISFWKSGTSSYFYLDDASLTKQ